ncbi:restriction endonuclease [Bacillus cereus]|uniref:restriction endonuclease n=1 Tax=Bacillus cereus TaxID=1396 RepID=UPI0034C5BDF1
MEEKVGQFAERYNLPIVEIDDNRNYWLVRTNAGAYFEEFFVGKFIAIGWDELTDFAKFKEKKKNDTITTEIENAYPDEQAGRIYGQIHRFLYEMQIGDVVMIPSENSTSIRFGIIKSEPTVRQVSETEIDEGACPYIKKREIEWIERVNRSELDPYLFKMMQSHQTISNANDYAHFIDRTLHSFFTKNGKAYLVLPVKKRGNIPAYDLVKFVNSIVDLVPMVNNIKGINEEYNKEDLDLKLNVQSPGFTEFFSNAPQLILGIGLLITVLTGSKFKGIVNDKEHEAHFKGLLEDEFLEQMDEFEKIKNSHIETLAKVEADLPEELKNLLAEKKRED